MMNLEGVYAALSVEVKRWDGIRSEGVARLDDGASGEDAQVVRKSLQGEYNAHVRRIDSLWRQFTDDYKREKGMPA